MCVGIDSTGNYKFAGSINGLVESTRDLLQIRSDECDRGSLNKKIGRIRIDGGDDVSVSNKGFHRGKL